MAISQTARILDLALAGHPAGQIAHMLGVTEAVVQTALQDLNATPSGQGRTLNTGAMTASTLVTTGDVTVGGKFGANGAVAAAAQAAYTKTYSTASRTIANATVAAVATTPSTQTTPWGYASQAQADAIPVAINALAADVLQIKKNVVALVSDLEVFGLAG